MTSPSAPAAHPTAQVHPTAVIGDGVTIGAGAVVGPFAVLSGPCEIGEGCWIGPHAVIGTPPEIRGWDHPAAGAASGGHGCVIGAGSVIREHVCIQQGSHRPTTVGQDCFIMTGTVICHDVRLGDGVTLSAGTRLAGHVEVGDRANLGLGTVVHQFRRIGSGTMVGMGAVVTRDVRPFTKAYGNPCREHGINTIGLERSGVCPAAVAAVVACLDADGAGRDAIGDPWVEGALAQWFA